MAYTSSCLCIQIIILKKKKERNGTVDWIKPLGTYAYRSGRVGVRLLSSREENPEWYRIRKLSTFNTTWHQTFGLALDLPYHLIHTCVESMYGKYTIDRPNLCVCNSVANWNRSNPPSGRTAAGAMPIVLVPVFGHEARGTKAFTVRLLEDFSASQELALMTTFFSEACACGTFLHTQIHAHMARARAPQNDIHTNHQVVQPARQILQFWLTVRTFCTVFWQKYDLLYQPMRAVVIPLQLQQRPWFDASSLANNEVKIFKKRSSWRTILRI